MRKGREPGASQRETKKAPSLHDIELMEKFAENRLNDIP